jgi:hypothetical protein
LDRSARKLGARMVWQPENTIHAPFLTRSEYAADEADGKFAADNYHMNISFGRVMLPEIYQAANNTQSEE